MFVLIFILLVLALILFEDEKKKNLPFSEWPEHWISPPPDGRVLRDTYNGTTQYTEYTED